MKFSLILLFFLSFTAFVHAQGLLPATFFDGKSTVLISNEPSAVPNLTWQTFADSIHPYLVRAGGDPIAYYELEQVALSAARQSEFAKVLLQRQIQTVVLITRQNKLTSIHVGKFSGDGKLIPDSNLFSVSAKDWRTAALQLVAQGSTTSSKNLLVPDVAEFPALLATSSTSSTQKFISQNPLNLEVFRLGIPLEGTAADQGPINSFRYSAFGKSIETILAEQKEQKLGLEEIFSSSYPHEIAWLTEARSNSELLAERIQFVLVRVEGRQADLMNSMGLEALTGAEGDKTVVKYYIRFLVRDEQYIGPIWDAHEDWKVALLQFLTNLRAK